MSMIGKTPVIKAIQSLKIRNVRIYSFQYISRPWVVSYLWVFVFCLFPSIWCIWDKSLVKVYSAMVIWVFISLGYTHKYCGCSNERCTPWVFPSVRIFIQHHHQIPHQFYEVYFLHIELLPPFVNIFSLKPFE